MTPVRSHLGSLSLLLAVLAPLALSLGACGSCDPAPPAAAPPSPATAAPAPLPAPTPAVAPPVAPAAAAPAAATAQAEHFVERFQGESLDPARWLRTRQHDFQIAEIGLQPDPEEPEDGRLRLAAATIGTRDVTVKHMGLVHPRALDLTQPTTIEVELDWAHQANGSYLTLGLYLSPELTTVSPSEAPDWLTYRLVGVPPGRTARQEVMRRASGNLQIVDRFGWPAQREGDDTGRTTVRLEIDGRKLRVLRDAQEVAKVEDSGVRFDRGYLYLEMSTHSNYGLRELFVDGVEVVGAFYPAPTPDQLPAPPVPEAPPEPAAADPAP